MTDGADTSGIDHRDTCPSCGEPVRFLDGEGPYCGSCEWRADDKPRLATDGGTVEDGTDRLEASSSLFDRWMGKASENIEEWGLQDEETLLLAIQEELGELTQAHLEATHEGGDPDRVPEELDDLGALLLQLHESHNNRSLQPGKQQNDHEEEA